MTQPQLQDLLEAGVHFGHQTRRWNPKMRRFIFAERSGIYIIDLQKTLRQIEAAQELLRGVVLKGEGVLFVCTKKQLKNILQAEAQRCGAFYVTERWLGGTLTNFQTIKRQIKRLKELEQGTAEGEFENYTKKEQLLFDRERAKLEKYLSGIKNMSRLPGALFVVDSKKERIAVAEANKLGIPVRSEEHTSELQSQFHLVCRLLLEKKKTNACTNNPSLCSYSSTSPSTISCSP